ncbi:MAG: DUF2795 domain-containing protein [Alphaproteobacteria bacterium]
MPEENRPLNLETLFDDMIFPANKTDLISHAQEKETTQDTMTLLRGMPAREYLSLNDLNQSLFLLEELPGGENQWSSAQASAPFHKKEQIKTKLAGKGKVR